MCGKLKPKGTYTFRPHPNFVFLCGAFNGTRRNHIQSLVTSHAHGEVPFQVFRAEDIWQELRERKGDDLDLLMMERYIGQISDIIIILVESPGTFAELGAFVTDKNLRDKLLLILDNSYESADSFINDGPVSYFNHGTNGPFRPALYTDFSLITSCRPELDLRLSQTPRQKRKQIRNIEDYSKLRFLYVLDLVALLGPVSLRHVHYFTRHIKLETKMPMVETLLLLGVSLGFIKSLSAHG